MIDAPPSEQEATKQNVWTEERKKAASEAAKARLAAKIVEQEAEKERLEREFLARQAVQAASAPQVEDIGDPNALTEMEQIRLALSKGSSITSQQIIQPEDDNVTTDRSGVAVTHTRERRIRMYKPTGECRTVPASNLERLLDRDDGGWTLHCPKCKTDCGGAPWGCGKVKEPQFLRCPVPECNADRHGPKKFYLRPEGPAVTRVKDPNEIDDPLFQNVDNAMTRAQSQLYAHMVAFHPDVAIAAGVPGAGVDR